MDAELDVVVIGGGIQGLLTLEALQEQGYASALVTDGDLGDGQTLHSHGFLNTGFGMLGDELQRASQDVVEPYMRAHGIEPRGEWRAILPPGLPSQAPAAPLPSGFDCPVAGDVVQLADRSFPKRELIDAVSAPRHASIVRGVATCDARPQRVAVTVRTPGVGDVALAARAVVVAAGCGSKRVLKALVGGTPQIERIQHRRVHMICVRAPRGSLPATSVVAMPFGLMLAAHENDDAVTWYVTPMEFGGQAYDDVPNNAASVEDSSMIARGYQTLLRLYPGLADVDGVVVGSYAGYRQDIGELPSQRLCEPVAGAENVIVALPSGLVAPWLNTPRIVELMSGLAEPSGDQPAIPHAGDGVEVGSPVEDRPGFVWQPAKEFARELA
jgi:glycine/D-amino acid oxidase-like deaminating enzyme